MSSATIFLWLKTTLKQARHLAADTIEKSSPEGVGYLSLCKVIAQGSLDEYCFVYCMQDTLILNLCTYQRHRYPARTGDDLTIFDRRAVTCS